MPSTGTTSLSADGPKPANATSKSAADFDASVARPPHADRLTKTYQDVEKLDIRVEDHLDGHVAGFLHMPPNLTSPASESHHRTAAILLSGAGGGVVGPSSIYLSLAAKLSSLGKGIPALRLDYRYPARNRYCVPDVKAAMDYLGEIHGLDRFVLVGWSFGGAPVFTVAAEDQRVVGCATVASQTAETDGIRRLAPRPVLLLHGKADSTLSYSCSERLYDMYGKQGTRELKLFPGDNHSLMANAKAAEGLLLDFMVKCAGLQVDDAVKQNVTGKQVVEDKERKELMKKGGDLRGPEGLE